MTESAIETRDCFVSYTHVDAARVDEIIAFLESENLTVYCDRHSIAGNYQDQEDAWIRNSHCMVLLLGPNGIGAEQKNEISKAKTRQSQRESVGARYMMIPVTLPWDPKSRKKTPTIANYVEENKILPLELAKLAGVEMNSGITEDVLQKLCGFVRAEAKHGTAYMAKMAEQAEPDSENGGSDASDSSTDIIGDGELASAWEQDYLTRSIVRWRLGSFADPQTRARAGRVKKIKKFVRNMHTPEACVPLLGLASSGRYVADLEHQILPKTLEASDGRFEGDTGIAKTFLAYWLAASAPRHILIDGGAGTGKTQFVTRAAAVMGERYLGKLNSHDKVMNAAFDAAGHVGLPIIFEANRMAALIETSDDDDLIAILAEIVQAATGPKRTVDPIDIENGLVEGRIVIIADGLDEVSDTESRSNLLVALSTLAQRFSLAKIILTARSRAYTQQFISSEKEIIRIEPLTQEDRDRLCRNFARERGWSKDVATSLVRSVKALSADLRVSSDEQDILDNPMMLTLACAYYVECGDLPKNRAALVDGIVDRLCENNHSDEGKASVLLTAEKKRRYLRLIAHGMQREGSRSWPKRRALTVIRRELKASGVEPNLAKEQSELFLKNLSSKTNIIRHVQMRDEPEVKFWHGLFQEYLCAEELIDQFPSHQKLFDWLKENEYFTNRFWGNVIRFLPAALAGNDAERRAWQHCNGLIELAQRDLDPIEQSRLIELAIDGVNQGSAVILQDDRDAVEFCATVSAVFRLNGYQWPLRQRIHILNGLARLGAKWGKVVPFERGWVRIPTTSVKGQQIKEFEIYNSPVTVQDFWEFLNSKSAAVDAEIWTHAQEGLGAASLSEFKASELWDGQQRYPGRPVTGITWFEAVAYCRWCQKFRENGGVCEIRLPTEYEWIAAARGNTQSVYPWGDDDPCEGDGAQINWCGAEVGHPAPVGTFPPVFNGRIYDLGSNVYEFAHLEWQKGLRSTAAPLKLGASWNWRKDKLRIDAPRRTEDPAVRDIENSFRCIKVEL